MDASIFHTSFTCLTRVLERRKIMANLAALSLFSFLFFLWAPAFSQDAKLIEAAKKEGGKIVAYGSL